MKKEIFQNGVRFLYKYREGETSSFCIALEAGANRENDKNRGVAHALEHMVFKGTNKYGEDEINRKLDELFAFNNAMTNFPYVIYYGVSLSEDFREGFDLYSNIVLNPSFNHEGFNEEISVIKEESREWKEDLEQYCEDLLLENAFPKERISEIIIAKEESVSKITLEQIKKFYNKFYVSENIVISVISSLSYEEVREIVYKNFGELEKKGVNNLDFDRKEIKNGTYIENQNLGDTCKIQLAFDISSLSIEEITRLRIFNMFLGEGVSSLLYDEIRTKKGLAYEVYSEVKWEKGIRIFKIIVNTSKKNRELVINSINDILKKIKSISKILDQKMINTLIKRYKLKLSLDIERAIVAANRTAIYEILYNRYNILFEELKFDEIITVNDIEALIDKVFKDKVLMILE